MNNTSIVNINLKRNYFKEPLLRGEIIPYEVLYDLYVRRNLPVLELERYLNCSRTKLYSYLKKYNLKKDKDKSNLLRRKTCMERYGVDNPQKDNTIHERNVLSLKETLLYHKDEIVEKRNKTKFERYGKKKEINKINKGKITDPKTYLYYELKKYFPTIVCNPIKTERFPYYCNFYISEIDTFIEYQGYLYKEPFDENNQEHIKIFNILIKRNRKEKQKAYIWRYEEPIKRKIAKQNQLNYIELWTEKETREFIHNIEVVFEAKRKGGN